MAEPNNVDSKVVSVAQLRTALQRNQQKVTDTVNQAVATAVPEMATDEEIAAMLNEIFGTEESPPPASDT